MTDTIEVKSEDGVQTLRINRPDKKNALTRDMYGALTAGLRHGESDGAVRAHVVVGLPGAFTAGNDISDFMAFASGGALGVEILTFLHTLADLEKPLVAAVDGLAIGIGTTLLFHCDLVYASPGSIFRTPFLDLGLVPEAASSLLGPAIMGHQRAFELLCLGTTFTAEDARRAGFVTRIASPSEVEAQAMLAAKGLAAKPPEALRLARRLLCGDRSAIHQRIDDEAAQFAARLKSPEAMEAFSAFMEKRPPRFTEAADD
ncbi:MAG: crotonase/enoyl-CoA hydratase family protein [Pseudomonadota bacterium]